MPTSFVSYFKHHCSLSFSNFTVIIHLEMKIQTKQTAQMFKMPEKSH